MLTPFRNPPTRTTALSVGLAFAVPAASALAQNNEEKDS
jgi:hypothetical protein